MQGQVPNLKFRGAFLPPLRATFIHTLWKKTLLILSCQDCVAFLVYLLEMWLVTHQNVSKKSAQEHNTRSR